MMTKKFSPGTLVRFRRNDFDGNFVINDLGFIISVHLVKGIHQFTILHANCGVLYLRTTSSASWLCETIT